MFGTSEFPWKSSLLQIYQTLNNAIFKCAPNLKPFVSQITRASIDIYEKSKSKLVLYVYSPRELTRWSRGLFEAIKSIEYRDLSQFLRLWYNEGLRLFYDRLSMEEDKFWTLDLFRKSVICIFRMWIPVRVSKLQCFSVIG